MSTPCPAVGLDATGVPTTLEIVLVSLFLVTLAVLVVALDQVRRLRGVIAAGSRSPNPGGLVPTVSPPRKASPPAKEPATKQESRAWWRFQSAPAPAAQPRGTQVEEGLAKELPQDGKRWSQDAASAVSRACLATNAETGSPVQEVFPGEGPPIASPSMSPITAPPPRPAIPPKKPERAAKSYSTVLTPPTANKTPRGPGQLPAVLSVSPVSSRSPGVTLPQGGGAGWGAGAGGGVLAGGLEMASSLRALYARNNRFRPPPLCVRPLSL